MVAHLSEVPLFSILSTEGVAHMCKKNCRLALAVPEIRLGHKKLNVGHVSLTMPHSGVVCQPKARTC